MRALVTGLGQTQLSRAPAHAGRLAIEAINTAVADAGLKHDEVDGLLIASSPAANPEVRAWLQPNLAREAGFRSLRLLNVIDIEGASAVAMAQYAAMAVTTGFVRTVVCVFADVPLTAKGSGGAAYMAPAEGPALNALYSLAGGVGGITSYALSAQIYLNQYGQSADVLGHVAVSNRAWARLNPAAVARDPIALEDYLLSPLLSEPLRVLDCAYPVNGASAIVIAGSAAAGCVKAPAVIVGYGQHHVRHDLAHAVCEDLEIGARSACAQALRMAGLEIAQIDAFELYDAFTIMSLLTLEEYGVCGPGEAGGLFASGRTRPGGSVPVSTGGGHTSGGYLQGMTPLVEGLVQVRREAGARQVGGPAGPTVMVSNIGGIFDHHATLVLAPYRN